MFATDCDQCHGDCGAVVYWKEGKVLCSACYYGGLTKYGWLDNPPAPPQPEEDDEDGPDKATKRLMADALKTHGKKGCPKCGYRGHFIRTALVCDLHGPFGGV